MPRLRPREEREAVHRLRASGMPFKRIAKRLGIPVSTVHCWSRDIELTPEQKQYNLRGPRGPQSPEHIARRMATWKQKNRSRREAHQQEGRDRARQGDALHQAGCMLYWAEGAKSRNQVKFANSDAAMVRFFLQFLRECFGVRAEDCRVRLNVYTNNGIPLEAIESHWLEALRLPKTSLRGHVTNHYPTSSSGRKKRKLPYGVCTLTIAKSTHLVQHIFGAIQEYAGFEEPRWLDGPPRKSQAGRRRKADPQQELKEAA